MTHFPGPWHIDRHSIKGIDHGRWYTLARVGPSRLLTPECEESNLRLIAAAPDLLAACERLALWDATPSTDADVSGQLLSEAAAMARAAIVRVTS